MKLRLLSILLILYSSVSYGQSLDSLTLLIKDIQKGETDVIRYSANKLFTDNLEKILIQRESFSRNFDSLKNVSVLTSDDNKLKLFTWAVPHVDKNSFEYFLNWEWLVREIKVINRVA